jgi:hypothetical protein
MIFGNRKKKGNAVIEGVTVIIVITVFSMLSIIGYTIFGEVNSDIVADTGMSTEAQDVSNNLYQNYDSLFDNLFMLMFVLFVVFTLVSAFVIDSHPIFFIVSLVLLMGVLLSAPLIANVYDDVMSDSTMVASANAFTYSGWVMSHLFEVILALVFMTMIVLFIKFKQ